VGLEHTRALEFLRDCAAGGELLCIAWITVMSYLRMATHPRLFAAPLSPAEAERSVSALISRPHVRSGMTDAQPR
jgi:predicted nucleic acid-binding protein